MRRTRIGMASEIGFRGQPYDEPTPNPRPGAGLV